MADESEIAREIKTQVATLLRQDPDTVSVSRVRSAVEDSLDLEDGYLKGNAWKERSKVLVKQAFEELNEEHSGSPPAQNKLSPEQQSKKFKAGDSQRPRKRKSADTAGEDSSVAKTTKARVSTSEADVEGDDLLPDAELSELEDDEPSQPKKRRKSKATNTASHDSKAKKTSVGKTAAKKAAAAELTPDEQEIKKLKSQLDKCGVRKVWGIELKRFETGKAKISHLRGMLRDVGMDGRFSEEKAKRIKEEREFSKDLADIKEGNKAWGRGAEEEEEEKEEEEREGGRPRRRLAKGLADLEMFQDDEESE